MKSTPVRLPKKIGRRLDALAARTGRPKASLIGEAIIAGIEDMEDYYLAVKVADDVHKGKETTFTAQEVKREVESRN